MLDRGRRRDALTKPFTRAQFIGRLDKSRLISAEGPGRLDRGGPEASESGNTR